MAARADVAHQRRPKAGDALPFRIPNRAIHEPIRSGLQQLSRQRLGLTVVVRIVEWHPGPIGRPQIVEPRAEVGEIDAHLHSCLEAPDPFRCFGSVLIEPAAALADVVDVDAVVICDMYTPITTPPHGKYAVEVAWLRRMYAAGALVATVCTGSVLLAETGLLDGRSCASHWAYGDLFREAYPQIEFRPEQVLDLAHEHERLITGGGVTAWQDLALHLIARYCGPEHAVRTAKVYLLAGHENGQLPFSAMTRVTSRDDAAIRRALAWIETSYGVANPVSAMAGQAGLLPRTFARRFTATTGRRPIDYVHGLRIEAARERLEQREDGVDSVGYAVGYEDPTFFRRLFKRTTGMTPAAYRRRYARIATPPAGQTTA